MQPADELTCFPLHPAAEQQLSAIPGGLQFKEFGIAPAGREEFLMRADGFDAAIGQDQDAVCHAH